MEKELGWLAVIVLVLCGFPGFAVFVAFLLIVG